MSGGDLLDSTLNPLKGKDNQNFSATLRSAEEILRGRILSSKKRIVVSGKIVELYEYSEPYFYNFNPSAKPKNTRSRIQSSKREDHILRARRQIRRLIEANISEHPIFITYTFKKNIKSLKKANPEFSKHVKELQRRYGRVKYLCVPEFQKRGAIHYHVIFFNLPYIKNIKQIVGDMWGHGFVQVRAIRKIHSVGAYVSKYLQKGVGDKRTIKHKAYFCSRGLNKPIEMRDEGGIDIWLSRNTIQEEAVKTFQRRLGTVTYKRFKIT